MGLLIAIGGNEDKADELIVLKRVVREIGKTDYKVGVITTASEDPEQRGKDYHSVFTTLGASRIDPFNIVERIQANDRKTAAIIEELDLIFFTGGDQLRLTTILGGTRIFDAIICTLEEIPITFGGMIDFNISNTLAAIGALHGVNIPIEQIRNGIMTFYPTPNQNPGRMNLFDFQEYKELLDYGHNPELARAMASLLPRLSPGRKVALCNGTGNRTTEQIIDYGKALALVYDYILLTDFAPRNRPFGETPGLVYEGLIQGGFRKEHIEIVPEPDTAVDILFSKAQPGDLLVIQPDELEPVMSQILEKYRELVTGICE